MYALLQMRGVKPVVRSCLVVFEFTFMYGLYVYFTVYIVMYSVIKHVVAFKIPKSGVLTW